MTPVARSLDEASLYLDLQPCEVCGRVALDQQPGVADGEVDGEPVVWLETVCANCGNRARFAFRVPVPAATGFGGDEPSQLIDPGQWLRLADVVTRDAGAGQRDRVALAVAAITEVLKFVKPGEDAVPGHEFWTDSGRQVFDEARWRFDKESLEFELDRYRRALAELT
ncbi:MAG: hypothetical protein AUG44_04290 [Actinobacteria bacterium 13_1_20CM_3_71_11]|nr:MAG: hypothetical protein AUG44_04290 [Actinobacteria bacterium 13_1_20CM_3_71_11]